MSTLPKFRGTSRRQFLSLVGAMSGSALLAACTLTIQEPATTIIPVQGETQMLGAKNIVLVHGAWADGSSWSGVVQNLQALGYNVTAVQNPLTSLADDVARTRQVLAAQDGPTVVVGHSYGGVVIGELGLDAPNVIGLVYVAAFALDEGASVQDLLAQGAPPSLDSLHPDAQGFLWFEPDGFVEFFAADIDPVQARVLASVQKPIAASIFGTPSGAQSWQTIPSWYLVAEEDQILPPQAQQAMAEHIGATVSSVQGSHVSLISHPNEVADVIVMAAQSVRTPA